MQILIGVLKRDERAAGAIAKRDLAWGNDYTWLIDREESGFVPKLFVDSARVIGDFHPDEERKAGAVGSGHAQIHGCQQIAGGAEPGKAKKPTHHRAVQEQ